jgi:hypothetical protein
MPLESTLVVARRTITNAVAMTQNAIDTRASVVIEIIGTKLKSGFRSHDISPKNPVTQARPKAISREQ